ncbi:hypothetical protein HRbin09_01432 [bacterium HR09]|nr:hypothetical protein HRbin09_01432 [bacterium HR09]
MRGPVATMAGGAGSSVTSWRRTEIRGCCSTAWVTARAKPSRSTAKASPAGKRWARAQAKIREPSASISRFKSPTAFSGLSERRELEHTSSARRSLWWAGVGLAGRIS